MLPSPIPSSSDIDRRFADFASQFTRHDTMSSLFNTISSLVLNTAATSSSLFLLQIHSNIPTRCCSFINSCSALCPPSTLIPSAPSSPTTPFHNVPSQSSTTAFAGSLLSTYSFLAIIVPIPAYISSLYGICHCSSPPSS